MLKFFSNRIVFREVPNEISLAISLTNCPLRCTGCHSPELQENIGERLTAKILVNLIKKSTGITCVLFLGGDASYNTILHYAKIVKNMRLKVAWYSGKTTLPITDAKYFDYIKIGSYVEKLGALDKTTTNQRFYAIENRKSKYFFKDITSTFWLKPFLESNV